MTPPADGTADEPDAWVAVASYPTRPFAVFVASALEGNGISTRVVGDDGGGMLPHVDTLSGGVHVEVPESEAAAAQALLEQVHERSTRTSRPPSSVGRWRTIFVVLVVVAMVLVVGTALLDL